MVIVEILLAGLLKELVNRKMCLYYTLGVVAT